MGLRSLIRRSSLRCLAFVLGLASGTTELPAQAGTGSAPALRRTFTIPLQDGRLDLRSLVAELCAAFELDASSLPVPSFAMNVRGVRGALVLSGLERMLGKAVDFDADSGKDELTIVIDRVRAREVRRGVRATLARWVGRLTGKEVLARQYHFELPHKLDTARLLVVLVHGVESDPASLGDLAAFLSAAPRSFQVATFGYPDDDAIESSAAELARRVRALGQQPVAIVGHSMGGLLGRELVENPLLDPGTVRALVLLGTPNQGSRLASLRLALEARDLVDSVRGAKRSERDFLDAVFDPWRDGLGEAGGDLQPGSVFLTQAAARPRNPKVEYHLVLGTRSALDPKGLDALRRIVREEATRGVLGRLARPKIESWLQDLDELVEGKGDGVVSLARGALEGVEATAVPVDHLGLVRWRGAFASVPSEAEHPVFVLVARWLAAASR